jgi:outer membrane protein
MPGSSSGLSRVSPRACPGHAPSTPRARPGHAPGKTRAVLGFCRGAWQIITRVRSGLGWLGVFGFGIALPGIASAQTLTLPDAIAQALAKNREIVVEREAVLQSRDGIARAEAAFDPVVRGEARVRDQKLPVISILSGAPSGELAPTSRGVSSAASFSRLFANGASLTATSTLSRDTSNNFLTLVSPAWFTSLGVEVRQPLLQGRAIDPARRALRVSRAGVDRSEAALRRVVVETVAAVEQAYWALAAARRDVTIRESTLGLAERQREDARVRVEAQVMPEADLAQFTAEIERRRGDLYASRETATRAELLLKALILESADAPQWNTTLAIDDVPPPPMATVDVAAALADAAGRPELADLDARLALQAIDLAAAQDRLKPQLDLVGGYTARGVAGARSEDVRPFPGLTVEFADELQGALGASLESVALQRFPDVNAGIVLTIPLGHRAARADIATAESARRQIQALRDRVRIQIALEVRNAAAALETAGQRIEAARATRDAAQIQLRAEEDRLTAGATTPFFVLTRQNDLAAAEVAEAAATAAYRRALTELARARGTLLRDRAVDWRTTP